METQQITPAKTNAGFHLSTTAKQLASREQITGLSCP